MPKKKVEKLSEKEIDKLYIVAKGFNVPDPHNEGEELPFIPGTEAKPNFVREQDFAENAWKILKHEGAVVLFDRTDELKPDETIAAEIIK